MPMIRTRRVISDEGAHAVVAAAAAFARDRGSRVVVAVVDPSGELVELQRTPGAQVASSRVAVDKARTAAIFVRASRALGRPSALHLARAVPLQGGIPLMAGDEIVGAIGVSGASSADEDEELAVAGANTFSAAAQSPAGANGATYFSNDELQRKFEQGGLLLDTRGYKLDAGRRVAPGEVEYHEREVDVIHVVEGQATVVTGGTLVEPREVAPGELRAASADGGARRKLRKGDVLAIPNRIPHQFVEVSEPFLYFVVKVEV